MFTSVYETLYHAIRSVAQEVRLRDQLVYCISEGKLPRDGGHLVVHYLGRQRFADDFLMFYDRDAPDAGGLQQNIVYKTSLPRFLRDRARIEACPSDADVLVIDRIFQGDVPAPSLAPHINATLPVQPTIDAQLQLIRSKGHRRKLQSALKHGFSWRKSHNLEDFNLFYDVMYKPFVQDRFRYGASIVPREQMYRIFSRRGFLLLVEEDGKPISGAMIYTSANKPLSMNYWKYGLAHAKELTPNVFGERNAMTEAMVLQYAVQEKFKEIDFGLTRAMPWDGIFTHKKRLGCDFKKTPGAPEFSLLINPSSRVRLLSRFPLIVTLNGGMHCWVGQEGNLDKRALAHFKDDLGSCSFASLNDIQLYLQGVDQSRDAVEAAVAELVKNGSKPINLHYL